MTLSPVPACALDLEVAGRRLLLLRRFEALLLQHRYLLLPVETALATGIAVGLAQNRSILGVLVVCGKLEWTSGLRVESGVSGSSLHRGRRKCEGVADEEARSPRSGQVKAYPIIASLSGCQYGWQKFRPVPSEEVFKV
jgi:hypothetical protein